MNEEDCNFHPAKDSFKKETIPAVGKHPRLVSRNGVRSGRIGILCKKAQRTIVLIQKLFYLFGRLGGSEDVVLDSFEVRVVVPYRDGTSFPAGPRGVFGGIRCPMVA